MGEPAFEVAYLVFELCDATLLARPRCPLVLSVECSLSIQLFCCEVGDRSVHLEAVATSGTVDGRVLRDSAGWGAMQLKR